MGVKVRNALELYRAGPEVTPSAQLDAFVLAASRAAPAPAPARQRREMLLAAAIVAAVVAVFVVRISTTPTQDFAASSNGRDEGLARAWLMNLDIQKPTGPGSQEGLP